MRDPERGDSQLHADEPAKSWQDAGFYFCAGFHGLDHTIGLILLSIDDRNLLL